MLGLGAVIERGAEDQADDGGRERELVGDDSLIDAARERARAALRAEAEVLANDPQDRAEAVQILRDMETLRAW